MITIPEKIIEGVKNQAIKELPNESCGYFAGNGGEVKEIFLMTNIDKSPPTFFL